MRNVWSIVNKIKKILFFFQSYATLSIILDPLKVLNLQRYSQKRCTTEYLLFLKVSDVRYNLLKLYLGGLLCWNFQN